MRIVAGLALALAAAAAIAQGSPEDMARRQLAAYPPAKFDGQPLDGVPLLGSLSNVTLKPAGDGPFPAVVLVHTCGGIKDAHIADHARELLALGYVVTVQDSFGPRGKRDCGPNNADAIPPLAGVNDAYAALAALRKAGFVDPDRIFLVGYSWGGSVAQLVSSGGVARLANAPARFRAAVANYPPCTGFGGRPFLNADSFDRPLLLLLGAKDSETPAAACQSAAAPLQAANKPIQVHVFPDTTHGWDKGGQMAAGYVYDRGIAREATQRMVRFLEEQGPPAAAAGKRNP